MPYISAKMRRENLRRAHEDPSFLEMIGHGEKKAGPEVDESWTKADVRRLIKLLKKRERLLEKLEDLVREEHYLEFVHADNLKRILKGEEL